MSHERSNPRQYNEMTVKEVRAAIGLVDYIYTTTDLFGSGYTVRVGKTAARQAFKGWNRYSIVRAFISGPHDGDPYRTLFIG